MREKGIPIPKPRKATKYDFAEWEVGDSELFDTDTPAYAAYAYGQRSGTVWTYRKVVGGFRLWRVK